MRNDVNKIVTELIKSINPYDRTIEGLKSFKFKKGRKILVAIGKASHTMASACFNYMNIDEGVVICKYKHNLGPIGNLKIFEAGHPITDENSLCASEYALDITRGLNEDDNVIFLISGGGSALFEKPLISLEQLQDINNQLLKCGASIDEINIIRKRLSMVKGGKFAKHCYPAHIYGVVLSDVLSNDLSTIASGPISIDTSPLNSAIEIVNKYHLDISVDIKELLRTKQVSEIDNVETTIISSNKQLCLDTYKLCEELGYDSEIVDDCCTGEARLIGEKLASYALNCYGKKAFIISGETVVNVKGNGLGGRNTELALSASRIIKGMENVCLFAFGSDGTDGPSDAAGGYVDGKTAEMIDVEKYLDNNDSYNALKKTGGLIISGPTGSNINDVYVLLVNKSLGNMSSK